MDLSEGVLCGLGGGAWVRCHSYTAGVLKRWRLREGQPSPVANGKEPLLGEDGERHDTSSKYITISIWFS